MKVELEGNPKITLTNELSETGMVLAIVEGYKEDDEDWCAFGPCRSLPEGAQGGDVLVWHMVLAAAHRLGLNDDPLVKEFCADGAAYDDLPSTDAWWRAH
jgi:hypothetical protein